MRPANRTQPRLLRNPLLLCAFLRFEFFFFFVVVKYSLPSHEAPSQPSLIHLNERIFGFN
jgi:hypothetical protein